MSRGPLLHARHPHVEVPIRATKTNGENVRMSDEIHGMRE